MVAGLDDSRWGYAVLLVVSHLFGAAPVGLLDGHAHRIGYLVGIHYHHAVEVSGGTAHGLGERAVRTQEALLVGVEYGHKRHFREIETLAEQVHAHQHVVFAGAEAVEYLYTVECIYIRVDVCCLYIEFLEVVVEFLGHAFGEGGDEHSFVAFAPQLYLLQKVIDLML